jgi:hypothetical protein
VRSVAAKASGVPVCAESALDALDALASSSDVASIRAAATSVAAALPVSDKASSRLLAARFEHR